MSILTIYGNLGEITQLLYLDQTNPLHYINPAYYAYFLKLSLSSCVNVLAAFLLTPG